MKVVGVDPEGSILALPDKLNDHHRLESYQVEGIGYDFIPGVCDRSVVDEWIKSNDKESLVMMRHLIRYEGLLCGGSSGSAVSCALQAARSLKKGQRCVVILPDSVRNYMSKALSDDWMRREGFADNTIVKAKQFAQWWSEKKVSDLPSINTNVPLTITSDVTCRDAIALLKEEGFDTIPVCDGEEVCGVVTEGNMTSRILSGRAHPDASVREGGCIFKTFHSFGIKDRLGDVAQALDHDPFVLITQVQRCYSGMARDSSLPQHPPSLEGQSSKRRKVEKPGDSCESIEGSTVTTTETSSPIPAKTRSSEVTKRVVVSGIVTRIDLLEYIAAGENQD